MHIAFTDAYLIKKDGKEGGAHKVFSSNQDIHKNFHFALCYQ